MDPVTAIGMAAVVGMFCTGVALVWTGMRRRPDRLPDGAEAVLAAVADGRITKAEHVIDLVRPPSQPPRRTDLPPSVRLLPREPELPSKGADSVEKVGGTVSEKVSEKVLATAGAPLAATRAASIPTAQSTPAVPVVAATPPVGATHSTPSDTSMSADVSRAIFDRVDDPKGDEFFATEPELQRF